MDQLKLTLHMNGGEGETSYAENSNLQMRILLPVRSALEEAILELCSATSYPDKLSVADLGCSCGPNTLFTLSSIVDAVEERYFEIGMKPPEFQLFLNDLPDNDFNTVFLSLRFFHEKRDQAAADAGKDLGRSFISGVPGSFHGRLFPRNSIHFFHSSSSLHWLSQVPPGLQQHGVPINRRSIYMAKHSPCAVVEAYAAQFEKDMTSFLRCRSEEITVGGRMVLTLVGRRTSDPIVWAILSQALMEMVKEGRITEVMFDSFNLPFFAPCETEMQDIIERQGSFSIKYLDVFEVGLFPDPLPTTPIGKGPTSMAQDHHGEDFSNMARSITKTIQAGVESMLTSHFGGDKIEEIFMRYHKLVEEHTLHIEELMLENLVMSLVRN